MASAKVKRTVKINAHEVISRAVEEGVRRGYQRAHKHVENPSEEAVFEAIETAVMGSLCEVLDFDS